MADVASDLKTWSTTASSNSPSGSTSIGTGLDDNLRELQKVVRQDLAHKGADIPSVAGTTDIGAVPGYFHDVTGTEIITGLGTVSAGIHKVLKFEAAATLTHNATSLILPNAASISTANGHVGFFISEGSGNWRCLAFGPPSLGRGFVSGLVPSQAADADHDITISAGECRDGSNVLNLVLASAITKQIDASWAVGSAQGGLDGSESVGGTPDANTWYYIWLIQRPDTGVVDALFSESASSPTMPTNYTYKRLVGAVLTDGSANIVDFVAFETAGGGLCVEWSSPSLDLDSTLTTSGRTDTIKAPTSFSTRVRLNVNVFDAGSNGQFYISNPDTTAVDPSGTAAPLATGQWATSFAFYGQVHVTTNSTGQVRADSTVAATDNYRLSTVSWEWARR